MYVIPLISLISSLCALSYAPQVKGQIGIEEFRADEVRPYMPFILSESETFYSLPLRMKIEKNEIVFQNDWNGGMKFYCPADDSSLTEAIRKTMSENSNFLNRYCLYDTKPETVKVSGCKAEVEPYIVHISGTCGRDNNGELFEFQYMACEATNDLKTFIENYYSSAEGAPLPENKTMITSTPIIMYKFCYKRSRNFLIYTKHKIFSPELFKNINKLGSFGIYESQTKSTEGYGVFEDEFKVKAEELKSLELSQIPHMYVPPQHMALGHWKKPTFHYANVKPMPESFHRLWQRIDDHILQKAIERGVAFKIYMGEFWKNYVNFWSKIVFDPKSETSVVIMMHDKTTDILSGARPFCHNIMKPNILCTFEKWTSDLEFIAYCCETEPQHLRRFDATTLKVKGYLNLDE